MSKTVIYRLEFTLPFSKTSLKQTWNSFNTKFQPYWKDRKSIDQVSQSLGLFCHLIAVILNENSVKDLRVTKNIKKIKFEGV